MSWTWVLRSRELDMFRGCRRQWDFGALERQGLVPVVRRSVFDLEAAVRMGLAVYYFPALDDWNRQIVRPLALKGFNRAMSERASAYEAARPLTPAQARDWQRHRRLGKALLTRYFDWADGADDFDSIFSDELVWTSVPDPDDPSRDLGLPGGRPIRFAARIDQLVSDPGDEQWIVEHRVVFDDWTPDAALLEDDEQLRAIWAIETAFPQLLVAGTIYNELLVRADDPDRFAEPAAAPEPGTPPPVESRDMSRVRHPSGAAARQPVTPASKSEPSRSGEADRVTDRIEIDRVRRTVVRRSRASITGAGRRVALERRRDRRSSDRGPAEPFPRPMPDVPVPRPVYCAAGGPRSRPHRAHAVPAPREEELEDAGLRRSDERRGQQRPGTGHEDHARLRWS